jgi:hypothetical protein
MGFKRVFSINEYPRGAELTGKLIGIGFKIGGIKEENPNIEDTIIAAAIEGMTGDFRTLSLLTDWLLVHAEILNVERLYKALKNLNNQRVNAYFASIGWQIKKDPRFKKIESLYKGQKLFLDTNQSYEFLVSRNGEDRRFEKTKLIVANGSLRSRPVDIATPREMVQMHKDYYYRTLIGPSFRADMVSCFLRERNISAADLARRCYGSFATAWQVVSDMSLIGEKV